jgi:hypothetical protein
MTGSTMEADVGLVAASTLHAGFQLVVTVLSTRRSGRCRSSCGRLTTAGTPDVSAGWCACLRLLVLACLATLRSGADAWQLVALALVASV